MLLGVNAGARGGVSWKDHGDLWHLGAILPPRGGEAFCGCSNSKQSRVTGRAGMEPLEPGRKPDQPGRPVLAHPVRYCGLFFLPELVCSFSHL